jgi:peptide chain release factor 3
MKTDDKAQLDDFKRRKAQYMAKDKYGRDVFLADSAYMLQMAQDNFPKIEFHFTSEID